MFIYMAEGKKDKELNVLEEFKVIPSEYDTSKVKKRVQVEALFAMGCITILEAVALLSGINGTIFSLVIAALAGLGGYKLARFINKEK